jgi:polyphosphate glucokinase
MTAQRMVEVVLEGSAGWEYNAVTIGFPGPVSGGQPIAEPRNLAPGWVGFDFEARFGKPVKVINDAAMQALGSYEGGRMLFLGLGTGLGTALILEKTVAPMELAHLPYRKGRTFEDYVGQRGLDRLGPRKWRKFVTDVVERLKNALLVDYVVLGGGNAKKMKALPPDCRLGDNRHAFLGGFRLWEDYHQA